MLQRKLNLIFAAFLLVGGYFLTLFLFSGSLLLAENAFAIIAVWLTGTFLICGFTAGVAGVIVAGFAAESLFALPTGTIIIASACSGLAMLHLSKVQSISYPWRGTVMAVSGAILWSGLVELIHGLQPGISQSGIEALGIVAWQGFVAATVWLSLLIIYLGIGSVFKQPRSTGII
ncbi:MAG: hypothetical protein JKY95_05465 [Planctomycetaceae bacterium]|nr:hypothetical protein [Planctomycetaceae bacterium]